MWNSKRGLDHRRRYPCKGKVTGNLNGKNIELLAGNVFGNISAQKDIHLDHQSLVIGNINAENVEAGGRIKGDLKIKDKTRLVSGSCWLATLKPMLFRWKRAQEFRAALK